MRLLIIIALIFVVILQTVNGSGRCTCTCCRGVDCAPQKQTPFTIESCDIDNKCNADCCRRYPDVCFPLPGPGFIDSTCENFTISRS